MKEPHYPLVEILTQLKRIIQEEHLFDASNPSVIHFSPQLEVALDMRACHVSEIRDTVLQHLTQVTDEKRPDDDVSTNSDSPPPLERHDVSSSDDDDELPPLEERSIHASSEVSEYSELNTEYSELNSEYDLSEYNISVDSEILNTSDNDSLLNHDVHMPDPSADPKPIVRTASISVTTFPDENDRFTLKPDFLSVIQTVPGVDAQKTIFTYREITDAISSYILARADELFDPRNIKLALVKDDPLGRAFRVSSFHRCQINNLIREQLIPDASNHPHRVVKSTTSSPGLSVSIHPNDCSKVMTSATKAPNLDASNHPRQAVTSATSSAGLSVSIHPNDYSKVMTPAAKAPNLGAYVSKVSLLEKHLGWRNASNSEDSASKLTQCSPNQFVQAKDWPKISSRVQCNFKTPPWELGIHSIPKISDGFFHECLRRNSLANTVRSIARILKTVMCPELLKEFGVDEDFMAKQKLGEATATDRKIITNNEMPASFKKLCFLSLVRWSTTLFPPAPSRNTDVYFLASIPFVVAKHCQPAMPPVCGNLLLPYISSRHTQLQLRLFQNSHLSHNPLHPNSVEVFHLLLTSTLQGCRTGEFASVSSHQRRLVSSFINKCQSCTLQDGPNRSRMLNLGVSCYLGQACLHC